jgi:hypothetical protein
MTEIFPVQQRYEILPDDEPANLRRCRDRIQHVQREVDTARTECFDALLVSNLVRVRIRQFRRRESSLHPMSCGQFNDVQDCPTSVPRLYDDRTNGSYHS